MTNLPDKEAFEKLLDQEVESARMMLEGPGRKVFVLAVCVNDVEHEEGGYGVSMCRSISEGTTRNQGAAYLIALERETARVEKLIA